MPDNNEVTLLDVYKLLEQMKDDIDDKYVSRKEFEPIKNVVYGLVSLILVAFVTGITSLVIK
jgi:hypothetical protein